jgi:SAM-dependent methyltransferase
VTTHSYGGTFFDYVDSTSGRSARALLARLDLGYQPRSVLDVGCGRGVWLAEWKARGASSVVGLDGDYVEPSTLKIASDEFRATDLARRFDLAARFDLVECLEVAEHLPASSAEGLVESIVRHGDVVLFSAAPPGQGGEHHVNERPLGYWTALFEARGYAAFDCVRPAVRGVTEVEPWYRYNTILLANEAGVRRLGDVARGTRLASGAEPPEVAPWSWQLRRGILRRLPRAVVEALARLRHVVR